MPVDSLCAGASNWNVRLVRFNLFDGGPCLNICHICCVHIFIAIVITVIAAISAVVVLPMIVVVAASVALVIAVGVTVVVAAVVIIITPRWTLTFFVTSFGPAVRLVVTELVTVEAFDIVLVMLLIVCGKGFIRAILAFFNSAAVILVRNKMDNLVWSDSIASSVSSNSDTTNSVT